LSRLRPGREAKKGATSGPSRSVGGGRGTSAGRSTGGRPGVFVQTPRSDIFVVMLGIALGAMVLGCLLLILILNQYDFSTQVSALDPPARTLAALIEKIDTVHL